MMTRTFVELPPQARILVKAVNWLGDLVMSLPGLWAIRLRYPRAHLGVLVRAELADFFSATSWVDTVIPYRLARGPASYRARWRLIRELQHQQWDAAVILPRSFESALWMYAARIPLRLGVAAEARSWLLTHPLPVDLKRADRHLTASYLELAAVGLGCVPPTEPPPLTPPSPPHQQPLAGTPFIVFAPGAAYGPAKEWPREYWIALGTLLSRRGLDVALVGTASEARLCTELASAIGSRSTVLAGKTTLPELMSLLVRSQGFIGNDSGATHLAAALGTPTVAIFGSTNPVRTAPLGARCQVLYDPPTCSPCLRRTCRFGHYDCLRRITPEKVLATLDKLTALAREAP